MLIPILRKTYPYTVELCTYTFGTRPQIMSKSTVDLDAAGLETETKSRWYILRPAVYHDSFYHAKAPANRQVPSQVTGAIAEAVTLRLFEKLYKATNIEKISERPNSRTADFAMDIEWDGATTHCLIETKGSNSPTLGPGPVSQAKIQLDKTNRFHKPVAQIKFASIVFFKMNQVDVVEVV